MANDDSDRNPIDIVVEEFADKLRRGLSPSINEYIKKHPQLANEIRELLPAVMMMEQLKFQKKTETPEHLGEYRILREIGRGRVSIVYEAEHKGLARRLALKVVHPHLLRDPARYERFQGEVRTVAQLHHTHIVPVLGTGECRGQNYVVVQYVPGCGLNEVVATLINPPADSSTETTKVLHRPNVPTYGRAEYWRWVAQIGIQAAEALQYAHDRGTLHRDVKPSNILLDAGGTAWVMDFGLAGMLDREEIAQAGDNACTIQYMAPEALHGHCDARSDLYSLALTLYELLTLRPPVENANAIELTKVVTEQDPKKPRSRNPAIPCDLEAIVVKGATRVPADRYQSAAELAGDLRRFLEDRPVAARPAGAVGRGWRWCRRNRAVASLGAVAATSLLCVWVAGWVEYERVVEKLERETRRRADSPDRPPPPADRFRRPGP